LILGIGYNFYAALRNASVKLNRGSSAPPPASCCNQLTVIVRAAFDRRSPLKEESPQDQPAPKWSLG
jgi:hypothetical protein